MILDLKGNRTTTLHKICISNHKIDKFLAIMYSKVKWTDNILFARTFETPDEALDFAENKIVEEVIGDVKYLLVWTDTKVDIYRNKEDPRDLNYKD
jgi:hypothetical protein